jgi:hypothetical protein
MHDRVLDRAHVSRRRVLTRESASAWLGWANGLNESLDERMRGVGDLAPTHTFVPDSVTGEIHDLARILIEGEYKTD